MVSPADTPILQLTIRPHRSLSSRRAWMVIAVVFGFGTILSLPFIILGYWPVAGFYGLDLGLLALAFRANKISSEHVEEIVISPIELLFRQSFRSKTVQEWRLNPIWTRLDTERDEDFGISSIKLVSQGHKIAIGQFLGPEEKLKLFATLLSGLGQAKRGPTYVYET